MIKKVHLPKLPIEGGCQCGAVRYRLHSYPISFHWCHCSECQKQSSSAFGESATVDSNNLEVFGELSVYERPIASGTMQCEFCPNCGTRLFHRAADFCNIKAGTFDDRSWLIPAGHLWTASKQPGTVIGSDELQYMHNPESYDRLRARWREMVA